MRRGPVWASGLAILAAALAGCTPRRRPGGRRRRRAASSCSYEDVLAPQAFSREGAAVADAPGGEPGFWAVTPGLPRPERGRVENLASGATIDVALFVGRGGPGGSIRLSSAAAEAIGIGAGTRARPGDRAAARAADRAAVIAAAQPVRHRVLTRAGGSPKAGVAGRKGGI